MLVTSSLRATSSPGGWRRGRFATLLVVAALAHPDFASAQSQAAELVADLLDALADSVLFLREANIHLDFSKAPQRDLICRNSCTCVLYFGVVLGKHQPGARAELVRQSTCFRNIRADTVFLRHLTEK